MLLNAGSGESIRKWLKKRVGLRNQARGAQVSRRRRDESKTQSSFV